MNFAKQIVISYAKEKQGEKHIADKTLTIVDTSKYTVFLSAWEALAAEMTALLATSDVNFHVALSRARSVSVAFRGSCDAKPYSVVDVGSFLSQFESKCVPDTSSQLSTAGRHLSEYRVELLVLLNKVRIKYR